ncbi:P-loop containing nucleoside triphosphate hydrolase protein [Xylariaceae sp. FL0594]|nr:P-loop containing nucleoside triphosphate hydrolase protein [Xylariaceae sp. FL0594]
MKVSSEQSTEMSFTQNSPVTQDTQQMGVPYLIRIRSPLLLQMLSEITGLELLGHRPSVLLFFRPFKLFVHFADEIREHFERLCHILDKSTDRLVSPQKQTETMEARECLRLLCTVLDRYLQPKIQLYSAPDSSVSTVSIDDLLRVVRVTGGRPNTSSAPIPAKLKGQGYIPGSFIIECFFIHFDGRQYGPVNQTFLVPKFLGERPLTALPIMSLACDPNKEQIREHLLARRSKFFELSSPGEAAHRTYCGLTLDKRPVPVDSNVIIDFELAYVEQPANKPTFMVDGLISHSHTEFNVDWSHEPLCMAPRCCGLEAYQNDHEVDRRIEAERNKSSLLDPVDRKTQLDLDHLVLLPPQAYRFVLRTRKWASLNIDLLGDVVYTNSWDRLVIKQRIKETILALVEAHEEPKRGGPEEEKRVTNTDLVRNKGNGLIIRLHGEPGVGKTSTAECVADHTRRPLFPLTFGDFGDNAQLVKTNLDRYFQLAHRWGCVLLLEEADIFLSRRDGRDNTRNAIVSVFLRTLEYYSGILFLTTSRVGLVDRAFKSRIHSIYYAQLNKETSRKIWEINLENLKTDIKNKTMAFDLQESEIMKFARSQYRDTVKKGLRPWDGRQIRNAFQTAIAFAQFEAPAESVAEESDSDPEGESSDSETSTAGSGSESDHTSRKSKGRKRSECSSGDEDERPSKNKSKKRKK